MASLRSKKRVDKWDDEVYTNMVNSDVPFYPLAIIWVSVKDRGAKSARLVALEPEGFMIDYSSPQSKVRTKQLFLSWPRVSP